MTTAPPDEPDPLPMRVLSSLCHAPFRDALLWLARAEAAA